MTGEEVRELWCSMHSAVVTGREAMSERLVRVERELSEALLREAYLRASVKLAMDRLHAVHETEVWGILDDGLRFQ